MTVRSLCSYGSTYCMQWVSNKVVTDIRSQLFSKMVRISMDFFNKMRSGFLMSRITNDTRVMQMALTTVSSDIFKQPITIVGAISVLLLMDWKFTLVTLVLFPTCLLPLRIYGRRARKGSAGQQEGMAEMVVTMQETFAGIRVIKSFAREAHQEKEFKRSNQMQFSQMMRIIRSMEADWPAGRDDRCNRRRHCVALCLRCEPERGTIFRTDLRNFHPLRSDQNTQQDPNRDAALNRRDNCDFLSARFGADCPGCARCSLTSVKGPD